MDITNGTKRIFSYICDSFSSPLFIFLRSYQGSYFKIVFVIVNIKLIKFHLDSNIPTQNPNINRV